jgi:hypothetical protein
MQVNPEQSRFSPYVYVLNRMCFKGSPYRATERLVAFVIASYISRKPDGRYRCYTGLRGVGDRTGLHKDTVKRLVTTQRQLCGGDDPIFELTPGKQGKGGRRIDMTNTYTIPQRHVITYRRERDRATRPRLNPRAALQSSVLPARVERLPERRLTDDVYSDVPF